MRTVLVIVPITPLAVRCTGNESTCLGSTQERDVVTGCGTCPFRTRLQSVTQTALTLLYENTEPCSEAVAFTYNPREGIQYR